MVNSLFTDINTILFLIFTQQAQHKFDCNTMHAQVFSENLMTCGFRNSNFLCYFTVKQQLEQITFWTFWMFSSFFDVEGYPECSLSSVEVWLSLKRKYHSWVCVLMASSPNTFLTFQKSLKTLSIIWNKISHKHIAHENHPFLIAETFAEQSKTRLHCNKHSTLTKLEWSSLWHSPK